MSRISTSVGFFSIGFLAANLFLLSPLASSAADYGDLPASAGAIAALSVGEQAPSFTVRTVRNEAFEFNPNELERPVILIMFRGGWCPYCNRHLSELQDVVPQLSEKGIDVYFLSGDRPAILYTSLLAETRNAINDLEYTIYSDADIDAARAFGIAYRIDDGFLAEPEMRGMDTAGSSMRKFSALPVPAVYVIDQSGKIVFNYVNADYTERLKPENLLAAAEQVAGNFTNSRN